TASFGAPTDPAPVSGGVLARVVLRAQRRRTWQIISTIYDIITANSLNARLAISQPDMLLRPDLGTIGIFDFHRWQEGVAAGKAAVQAVESELAALASGDG
ncbi:MAG: hypothetical protein ACE5G8_07025, partial [Anaerolineae bacterium]